MQRFKRFAGRHVSSKVEIHFTNQLLLGQSLERMRRRYPLCRDLGAILGRKQLAYSAPQYNAGDDSGGLLLLGVGAIASKLCVSVLEEITESIEVALRYEEDQTLRAWGLQENGTLLFWASLA